jgi:alkylation response protein AidB-like acyl-CoA dehydrogenase
MNVPIHYEEEHALLRAEARRWLEERFPIARVRSLADSPRGEDPADWKELAELGWLGLVIPEKHGGAGLGATHLAVLMEETGRRLVPSPLLPSTLAALALVLDGSDAQIAGLLPALASGETRAVYAHGASVWGAEHADLLVVSTRDGVEVLERSAAALEIRPEIVLDRTRRSARVTRKGVALDTPQASGRLTAWACLALAAEMAGGADALLAMTAAYTATREQFGKPIGSFQAVKHPLVNVLLGVEGLRSLVYAAASALDAQSPDAEALARMAKAQASDVYVFAASRAVQLHGGFGFTLDCDAHLYLKRAQTTRPAFGDAMAQRRWLAERLPG